MVAQVVSLSGSQVTALALPTIAVLRLHAGPAGTSFLFAASYAPAALLGPFVAPLIDRLSQRTVLAGADLLRAAILSTVPVSAALGLLSFDQLVVVAALVGLLQVLFDSSASTLVARATPPDQLARANGFVQGAQSIGSLAGPGLGGVVIGLVGAATAVILDVISYGLSAALLATLAAARRPAAGPQTLGRQSYLRQVRNGWSFLIADPLLRGSVLASALANLGGSAVGGLYIVYAYNVLGLSPQQLGLTMTCFSAGSLLAAVVLPRAYRGRPLHLVALAAACGVALSLYLIPLASIFGGVVTLCFYEGLFAIAATTLALATTTLRQRRTPPDVLGRVLATSRSIVIGTIPLGAGLGAALSGSISLTAVFLICAILVSLAPIPLATRGYRRIGAEIVRASAETTRPGSTPTEAHD